MAVDKELVQALNKAVAGEEEGFNVIYQKTYSYVYARCRMIMKNEDDAQELLQETYLQAYRSLDKLENVNGIFAWIGAIAYNQGMKVFRKKKEVLLDEDGQGLFEVQETADVSTLPGHEMELKETADIVKDIIEELPDVQRAVITAYYYDEMSVSKIAELMGTSTGTIKSRLNYARKHIQESVEAKEKQMGIKLHSVSIPILILALQGKANAMSMPAEIAEANYAAICSKSGITTAGLHAGEAGAAAANVASGEASVASGEAAGAAEGITEAANGGSNVLDNLKSNYTLDVTSSEYGDEDYISYNGTSAFTFYNDDAGEIEYQNVQVDNIVMLGLYPGMDENEAYEKLERYGMRRSDESEVVTYVSGENADNIGLNITVENGKVSMVKIFFRPIIAG